MPPRPYTCSILPRRGRWRVDLPGALAIFAAIAFVTGVFSNDIRTNPTLGPIVWGSGAGAVLLGLLARRGWYGLRWLLTVDEHGIRLHGRGKPTIDLGVPREVTHGRFKALITAGKMHRMTPHLWVAVTSSEGRTVVLQRAMGIQDRVPPDWPEATPPRVKEVFSSVAFDPVYFWERASALRA